MRLEALPLVLGVLLGLVAIALLFDAWAPDASSLQQERRHSPRRDRDRKGEALMALGALAMAATFIGRDGWRYSVVAVIVGAILLGWGVKRNSEYLRGVFTHSNRKKPKYFQGARRVR